MKQTLELSAILPMLLCYLGYVWAANYFCEKSLSSSQIHKLLFPILLFFEEILLYYVNETYSIPYLILALFHHIVRMGMVFLLFRERKEKKILIVSIWITVEILAENFCESFCSCLLLVFLHTVKAVPLPVLNEWEINWIVYIRFAIVILVLYYLSKRPIYKSKKYDVLLAIPLLSVTAVMDVVNWGASKGINVKSGGNMGVYYDQIFGHMEICILAVLSMFAAGFYLFGMDRIFWEQKKSSQYQSQIAVYKMLEEQYSQSERLRHDMKNHMIALLGLLQQKEYEKMGSYINRMVTSGNLGDSEDITGNRTVDVLLYQKRKLAEEKAIMWECDVQIPKKCRISEFDFCVLFGNLLDNALEACEKLPDSSCRFIQIQSKMVKKCFLLESKNSTVRKETWESGVTKKVSQKEYGIGLWNIHDMVHQYDGVMNIEVQGGIYVVSILLPIFHSDMTSNCPFGTHI